jgi:hypothetical protein
VFPPFLFFEAPDLDSICTDIERKQHNTKQIRKQHRIPTTVMVAAASPSENLAKLRYRFA